MTRCRCLGSSHGPACPLIDAFDYQAEEKECQRIEAALAEQERREEISAGGDE